MKYINWLFGKDGALFRACAMGKRNVAAELLGNGANVNATSSNGFTPLHRAAEHGHIEIVELLVKHGAKTNAHTKSQSTPLMLAARNGHDTIAKLLEEHEVKWQDFVLHMKYESTSDI